MPSFGISWRKFITWLVNLKPNEFGHGHSDTFGLRVVAKQFIARRRLLIFHHPPHSPDLAQADFFLFQQLKQSLRRERFID